jgi:hypothetical protein
MIRMGGREWRQIIDADYARGCAMIAVHVAKLKAAE